MKASGWIDRIKAARGWESDYRVAKELGVGRATVSNYRVRESTLDEDMAIKVATALGERPEAVLLDQYAERTKNPEVRSALSRAARDLCILCKVPKAMELIAAFTRAHGASLAFC
jgi:plasmid maintenance system antidote protein VapI